RTSGGRQFDRSDAFYVQADLALELDDRADRPLERVTTRVQLDCQATGDRFGLRCVDHPWVAVDQLKPVIECTGIGGRARVREPRGTNACIRREPDLQR